jgi:hypothetical protein
MPRSLAGPRQDDDQGRDDDGSGEEHIGEIHVRHFEQPGTPCL